MSKTDIFNVALYLRLSRDDKDIDGRNKTESNSISSQRDLLMAYVRGQTDLQIFDIYIDDGYSGADFNRPEFERMLKDIGAGRVNCVIVKDLSRFGRDYIEAGRFIQKTFPAFNVRFIAVTDNYDSLLADKTEPAFMLPVKNFVNDSYCRDISIKVKAQQRVKRLEGKCISAFTVYGYLKNPNDKNQLITDCYAADIVRRIFLWKIEGMSLCAIANRLNKLGILSPMEYKKSLGMKYRTGFDITGSPKWAAESVKRILTNRVYIGYMEQGKQEKISYKLKKRIAKPKEEWIQVKNTHEAIISEADYDLVKELLRFDGRISADTDTANPFNGILMCAECKVPMIKRVNKYKDKKKVFYICRTKNKSSGCSRHSISEEVLKKLVLREINVWLDLSAPHTKIADILSKTDINYDEQTAKYEAGSEMLRKEYDRHYRLLGGLRADLEDGLIDEEEAEELCSLYKQRCMELEAAINSRKAFFKEMLQNGAAAKAQLDTYREAGAFGELTRELLVITVGRIYVHENKELDIVFRFNPKAGGGVNGKEGSKIQI